MNPSNQNPYGLERPPFPQPQAPVPNYDIPPIAAPVPVHAPAVALDPKVKAAAIALFACCAAMLVGLASHRWFVAPDGDGGLGILGMERCRRAGCMTVSWWDVPRAPGEIQMFAGAGLVGILVAVGFLIHTGVMLLRNKANKILLTGTNIALAIAAFGVVAFVVQLGFGELSKELKWGWGAIVTPIAVLAAGGILSTVVRPLVKQQKTA